MTFPPTEVWSKTSDEAKREYLGSPQAHLESLAWYIEQDAREWAYNPYGGTMEQLREGDRIYTPLRRAEEAEFRITLAEVSGPLSRSSPRRLICSIGSSAGAPERQPSTERIRLSFAAPRSSPRRLRTEPLPQTP